VIASRHYCTYFDLGYLAQGLALWGSLSRHDAGAILWVLALDAEAASVLRQRGESRLRVVDLAELLAADPELAGIRASRARNEFIFTLTPCWVGWLLRIQPDIDALAYVDADLFFFADPEPIWRELAAESVLVTPHRYPRWHDGSAWYGRYNVGVIVFRNDTFAHAVLRWWRERCLESSALESDGSAFGDQKYLDEWPRRFEHVVESAHVGVNAAPWNWAGQRWRIEGGRVLVGGQPLIVFHFAQFRRVAGRWFDSGQLEFGIMPLRLRSRLYGDYWSALLAAEAGVRAAKPDFSLVARGWDASLGAWHLAALRLGWGQFWWKLGPWWVAGRLGLGRFSGRAMGLYRRVRRIAKLRPRVLVVTPTLGDSRWLPAAVASVAAQPAGTTHVLVAPAGATARLQAQFPQVRVIAETPGGGMYAAINAGVAAVRESWDVMTYLNDDDVLLPGFASIARAAAARGDLPAIAYGGVRLIDGEDQRLGAIPVSHFSSHNRALYARRLEPVYQHGIAVNRAAWERLQGFDATFRYCGDSEFLARACVTGIAMTCASHGAVAAFRLRPGQLTKNRPAMEEERRRVDEKLGLLSGPSPLRRIWVRCVFRIVNLPVYAERILRHGFVTFDELIRRAG
jgi:hypothetical protein